MRLNLTASLTVIASILLVVGCKPETSPESPPPALPADTATNAVAAPAPEKFEYAKLVGKWERPDGGYVLEFRAVDGEGKLDAGYFNPSPINVEKAQAFSEGGEAKVFVILRDVNYPGSTYQLAYDPKNDQLYGQYYQATMKETYDVTFARQK